MNILLSGPPLSRARLFISPPTKISPTEMDNSNLSDSDFLSIRQRFYSNESLSAHPPEHFTSGDRRTRRDCIINLSRNKGAKINMGVFY